MMSVIGEISPYFFYDLKVLTYCVSQNVHYNTYV